LRAFRAVDSATALRVGTMFETLLFEPILEPLTRECDALGSYGTDLLAGAIAQRDVHGFALLVAGSLEGRHDRS
jgi:hypothetical protein